MRLFRGYPLKEPQKLLADTLYKISRRSSIEDAIQTYKNLKKTDSAAYDYSSSSLEFLGERLLLFQNYNEATAAFHLLVQENPDDASGYFYLGKAYEKWGRFDEAVKAYQMAVSKGKNARPAIDAAFQIKYLQGLK